MKVVPKLKKEKLEDAKKILDEAGILYEEDEEKEFSLSIRRGRVIRTEPKEEEKIKNKDKVTIYVSKLCLFPFLLIFLILFLLIFVNFGISTIYTNNRPIIDSDYEGWVKSNTVYVKRDVDVSEVDTYLYCVTKEKNTKKCNWERTNTKNTLLSKTGKWNVFFKAKYKNGKYSFISNKEEVLIDNDAPIVESINSNSTSNTISFNIKARDNDSGIKSYFYKIGNNDYVDANSKFIITNLKSETEYTITIRVEDKAGNIYEITYTEKTKVSDTQNNENNANNENNEVIQPTETTKSTEKTKPTELTTPSDKTSTTRSTNTILTKPTSETTTSKTTTTKEVSSTQPIESTKPTTEATKPTTEATKPTTEATKPTKPVEPEIEIPKIDLKDLPGVFEYGESYQLPSHVEFGPSGGEYYCALDHDWSKNVSSTEGFAVGNYTVSCKAVSNTGTYAEVSKNIKVVVPSGEDEEWDGWIRLNLYYPLESTNREWRLHREGEIRGEDEDWQAYTGPILVKVSDIENIYIRYDVKGEKVIDVPTGKVLVDISPEKMVLSGEETTNVKITYDKNAKIKEYRINGGDWLQYKKEFKVGANSLIEARVTKEENIHDTDGNVIMQKTLVGEDAVYISEKGESSFNFGNVRIDINPEKEHLEKNEKTNVIIDYEADSIVRKYKVDDSPWLDYTGPFIVNANSTVYAYAESERTIDLDNEVKRIGKAIGRTQKTMYASNGDDSEDGSGSEGGNNPENSLYVNIKSSHSRLLKGQKAIISIVCNEENSILYYSLDNKNYILYTGSFEVGANTNIYAKAVYQGKYAYDMKSIEAVVLSDRLEGPVISISPTTLTESVLVDIKTNEEAKAIYYSVDGGVYHEYTEPFTLNKNCIVRSYYIRSDNKKSETTYYYVQNIKVGNKPYVRIDARPSIYLSESVDMVEVVISGTNYDTLEYSFNGIEYFPYTKPLEITRSRSVYARGKNTYGETIEKLNITTSVAPTPVEKLDVAITLNPEENELEGLIDKLNVTINYDKRATSRYYRIGSGELIPYTGPFEVTENTTVYAYAISDGGLGESRKQINYLTTGIANPVINVNPETPNSWVRVSIDYASTASVKKYKIDNGEWLDYTGPIELITNNTTVYAYNEDTLSHHEEASKFIDNIIPKENIQVLDNGMYYLIKLNYPSSSKESDREYKWKKDGVWKKYDEKGILLIRPEYKDKVIGADGVKVKDSNGKEIIFKDHYYVLDIPLSEMAENLYMRWNLDKPKTPTFTLSTEEWTREVTVAINYDKVSVEKLYKIVNEDGTDTGWLNYTEPVKINKNNAIIYAKSANDVEIESEIGSKKITNIDTQKPNINAVNVIKKGSSNITVEVSSEDDLSGLNEYMYSLDNKGFVTITDATYTFKKLKHDTEYTIFVKVKDKAGNESDIFELSVMTNEIGELSYLLDKEDWATSKVLTINYPEDIYSGYTYEYSLDLGETWLTYTDPLTITENNTTVIARVVDGENIKVATSFTVSKIDPTIPTISLDDLPSIFSKDKEYALPSSYTDGPSGSKRSCKVPNRENEYTSSSDLPTGKYTLTCTITTGAGVSAEVAKDISVTNATIKGDSVLSIIQENNLAAGYYDFEVLGTSVIYPVHLYVLEGDQRWSSDQIFGDAGDVATKNDNARNMVVVKVKGNVTIEEGVTVRPYYDELYGGPKGFTLYVTGKLENNGTIDNSHGAKAEGQDVYLWKNADGTYEYVPAVGAEGGAPDGKETRGIDGEGRQTGGGGAAGSSSTTSQGGKGTSYSGGSGGSYKANPPASDIGGQGGGGYQGFGGGAGNPGGGTSGYEAIRYGSNGTGGLLILYANEYKNNGLIIANGSRGGYGTSGGGGSGGGSINVFYTSSYTPGVTSVIGGSEYDNMCAYSDCSAGNGTVNYTQIELEYIISTFTNIIDIQTPQFNIDSVDSSSTKKITINYPSGYTNEYSLDFGDTWSYYTSPITIDHNVTVIARTRSGDKTLSSSSFTITKIKDGEANIPNEFIEGDDYKLPESCMINDKKYDNINELVAGSYNLVCELTNRVNPLVNKTITVKKREEMILEG